jgi:hypothetical protein
MKIKELKQALTDLEADPSAEVRIAVDDPAISTPVSDVILHKGAIIILTVPQGVETE